MYETFFGLEANPFAMTPDPQCYFMSESHREAFAGISYGIANRRGFMTLVGEVGTGKTTLLNAILSSLDPSTVKILVRHTTVDREELLRIILHNLYTANSPRRTENRGSKDGGAVSPEGRISKLSRVELINAFYAFVTGEYMAYQPPPLLIIDESQNLSVDVLEEVRLLTNLEDPKTKMLQVILSGQPELEEKLMRSDLRQLRQRIAVNARLEALSLAETSEYIAYRLGRAGCTKTSLFTPQAVEAIWSASRGSPRSINVLCDHALVNAFAVGSREVEVAAAREAVQDVLCLQLRESPLRKPGPYLVTHLESREKPPESRPAVVNGGDTGGNVG